MFKFKTKFTKKISKHGNQIDPKCKPNNQNKTLTSIWINTISKKIKTQTEMFSSAFLSTNDSQLSPKHLGPKENYSLITKWQLQVQCFARHPNHRSPSVPKCKSYKSNSIFLDKWNINSIYPRCLKQNDQMQSITWIRINPNPNTIVKVYIYISLNINWTG